MSNYKMQLQDVSSLDKNLKIVFISAEFNRNFTKGLEDKSEALFKEEGFNNISKFMVPGAYEIPGFLQLVLDKIKPDLVLCFGVVIRGETTHYEMVAGESARGITNITLQNPETSIINGILTCENEDQVIARITDGYAVSGMNLLVEKHKIK